MQRGWTALMGLSLGKDLPVKHNLMLVFFCETIVHIHEMQWTCFRLRTSALVAVLIGDILMIFQLAPLNSRGDMADEIPPDRKWNSG